MNRSFTDEEILTREEVMDVLKIGRSTFYKLIKSGDLKGFLEGNRYKVPAKSITDYIAHKMESYRKLPESKQMLSGFSLPALLPCRCLRGARDWAFFRGNVWAESSCPKHPG